MEGRRGLVLGESAQATVEMAVVAPVLIVLALISYNMMVFLSATARFDRVAPDIVLVHGSSPASTGAEPAPGRDPASDAVRTALERAMEGYEVEIEVDCVDGAVNEGVDGAPAAGSGEGAGGSPMLGLVGAQRTFRCSMRFRLWPQIRSIAGVEFGAPFELRHMRAVVIDPWRSGVVV